MKDSTTLDGAVAESRANGPDVVQADRYVVGGLLGEGGMGEVRLATDRRTGREVALKVVLRRGFAPRFLREARVQAQLEHPGIVPVFDVGQANDGRVYFTMKRVEGVTLDEVLQRVRAGDPLYPRHALLSAFLRICLTVAYAHARGVLHRDLKPSNVMLGAYREVYVLDWGIAKPGGPDEGEVDDAPTAESSSSEQTVPGATLGTPAYMAPERAAGAPADERTDVFALGAILFELLAQQPLLGEQQIEAARNKQAFAYDAKPSSRRPETSSELDLICLRATAPNPAERFASARELHDAIAAHLDADRESVDRKRLAEDHTERARVAMASDLEDKALGEIGQALALDASSTEARRLYAEVMSNRENPPPKVLAEVEEQRRARLERITPNVILSYTLPWVAIYPIIAFSAGVRSRALAIVPVAAWCVAALVVWIVNRWKLYGDRVSYTGAATLLAVALTTCAAGPFFMVPQLAAVIVTGFTLVDARRQRPFTIAATLLAVLAPTMLAWAGVHDVYTFTADGFRVDGAIHTPAHVFFVGLTACEIAVVAFAYLYVSHYRSLLDEANVRNALVSWQLEEILAEAPSREPVRDSVTSIASDDAPRVTDAPPARRGARYRRLEQLGPSRYRAWDDELARDVRLDLYDRDAWERVCREARLVHPAIAPVYDVGVDGDGKLFTVTRLSRGTSLDVVLERDRPPGLLAAFAEVCLAVDYAHANGAVHGALGLASVELGAFGEIDVVGWTYEGTIAEDVVGLRGILRAMIGANAAPELEAMAERTDFESARALHDAFESFLSGQRDRELRRRLARTHLEHARVATERALGPVPESRIEALREAGRALAFGEASAGDLLLRLLTTPPEKAPPVVLERVRATDEARGKRSLVIAALFAAFWFTLFPLAAWWIGVRDLSAVLVVCAAWLVAELVVLGEIRFGAKLAPFGTIAMMSASAFTSAVVGPFFLVGMFVTIFTMTRSVIVPARFRWLVPISAVAALVVPTVLAWTGVHPVYAFEGDVLVQRGALLVDRTTGFLGLTVAHVLAVLFSAGYTARFRDTLEAVEVRNMYAAWKRSRLLRRRAA